MTIQEEINKVRTTRQEIDCADDPESYMHLIHIEQMLTQLLPREDVDNKTATGAKIRGLR